MGLASSILWNNADGTVCIMKPTESARLKGETDAVFLDRALASMVPVGAVNKRIVSDSLVAADTAFATAETTNATARTATMKAAALAHPASKGLLALLAILVTKGTITQAQSDAVKAAIQ